MEDEVCVLLNSRNSRVDGLAGEWELETSTLGVEETVARVRGYVVSQMRGLGWKI